jgi:four helix bundle protein
MSERVRDFDDLRVYRTSFKLAMEIFELSRRWPRVEDRALTDQVRRSSRSVSANIAEAWGKRRYEAHFVQKLSTAESEAAETMSWLDFAASCGYLKTEDHRRLREEFDRVRGGLIKMMANPKPWCGPSVLRDPPVPYPTDPERPPPQID